MTQKRTQKTSSTSYGDGGLATLVKLSPTQARVDFIENAKTFEIVVITDGEQKNIPDYFKFNKLAINAKLTVKITITSDNKGIYSLYPANSEETVKFLNFSGGVDAPPVPKVKDGVDGWGKPFTPSCGAWLEITEGKWKGAHVYAHLTYEFAKDGDVTTIYSGKRGDKLAEFMDAIGVDCYTLPYSENLLPEIQKQAKANDRRFQIFIEKGWVNRYSSDSAEAWVEDEETVDSNFPIPTAVHPALAE